MESKWLKLLFLLKQLKNWTKCMEQQVSDIGQQAVKDRVP